MFLSISNKILFFKTIQIDKFTYNSLALISLCWSLFRHFSCTGGYVPTYSPSFSGYRGSLEFNRMARSTKLLLKTIKHQVNIKHYALIVYITCTCLEIFLEWNRSFQRLLLFLKMYPKTVPQNNLKRQCLLHLLVPSSLLWLIFYFHH